MAARALIIAIESYSKVNQAGIASVLPGTLEAGIAVREWMLNNWKLEGRSAEDYQLLFCSDPPQAFGTGASQRDILKALHKIRNEGQGTTDTFHFYFSGHGFSFVERPGSRADILLSSDFENAELSSNCCFNLDEVISWLRDRLGPGKHYYFIDACRNKLDSTQIQVGKFLANDAQVSEEASTFLLQSTVDGAVAAVADTFPKALLDGLRGKGKAKVWDPQVSDAMLVKYESLRSYLADLLKSKQAISSKVEGPEGPSDAVLATLRPIPMSTCEVQIINGSGREHGEVVVIRGRAGVGEHRPVTSPTFSMSLEPDRYFISLQLRNASVEPATPVEVDLYENRKLVFTKAPAIGGAPQRAVVSEAVNALLTTEVEIVLPTKTELRLRNMQTGHEIRFPASCKSMLPQGRYVAEFRGPNDRMLRSEQLELAAEPAKVDFADWARSVPHVAIAQRLPHGDDGVEFSESLGEAITDTDLNLWLALIGGGRILGSQGDYSKLAKFPLRDFMSETKGASPIYVLAGFDDAATRLQVGLSNDENVQWIEASEPPGLQGIREAYIATPPGTHLLSFRRADEAPYTIATVASPNRAMLVVLTVDDDGNLAVDQYLLPIGHLVDELPEFVKNLLRARNQLSDLRLLAQASRSFRQRRDAFKLLPPNELDALLCGKWLNPIASCMAAYEFLRRGNKQDMQIVVQNLKSFFADLPDTTALARLIGAPDGKPRSVPIFADGLKAYPDDLSWLPLPAGHLDFGSVWTAWRVAVK